MHADGDDHGLEELRELAGGVAPPPALEERIIRELRRRRLIASPRTPLLRAALVLLPLVAGFAAGWIAKPLAVPRDDTPRYILLLYGRAGSESEDLVTEYRNWATRMAESGRSVSGEKLSEQAELVLGAPLTDRRQALRGFFIVEAPDDATARAIALTHPHIRRGGTVVVRRLDGT
jgi:hypothetical protein